MPAEGFGSHFSHNGHFSLVFRLRLGASISHSVCLSVCPQHEIGNVLPRPVLKEKSATELSWPFLYAKSATDLSLRLIVALSVFNIKLTMGLPLTVLNAKSAT